MNNIFWKHEIQISVIFVQNIIDFIQSMLSNNKRGYSNKNTDIFLFYLGSFMLNNRLSVITSALKCTETIHSSRRHFFFNVWVQNKFNQFLLIKNNTGSCEVLSFYNYHLL